jgi:hypothetical protein
VLPFAFVVLIVVVLVVALIVARINHYCLCWTRLSIRSYRFFLFLFLLRSFVLSIAVCRVFFVFADAIPLLISPLPFHISYS